LNEYINKLDTEKFITKFINAIKKNSIDVIINKYNKIIRITSYFYLDYSKSS